MSKFKRVLGLSVLAALLATAAMAVPAQANVKGDCVLEGTAGVTDKDEPKKGVRLLGGHGSYNFAALAIACVGLEKGSPAIVTLNVTSKGYFDNIVCGTGVAWSHKTTDGDPNSGTDLTSFTPVVSNKSFADYDAIVEDLEYKIEFAAGIGHIHVNNDGTLGKELPKPVVLPQDKGPGPDEDLELAGVIGLGFSTQGPDLLNTKSADPTDRNCVKSFSVLGSVKLDKS
jgi:hypothetical protein